MRPRIGPVVALCMGFTLDAVGIIFLIKQEWFIGACFLVPVFLCLAYVVWEFIRYESSELPIEYYEYEDHDFT